MTVRKDIVKKAGEWTKHAEEDFRLAKHAFKLASSCPYKLIAFHAQQCVEKYLKAFLLCKNVDFPYTHNISLLLELCLPHAKWTVDLQEAKLLTDYAITARYPGRLRVSRKDAENAVRLAAGVKRVVRAALKKEFALK